MVLRMTGARRLSKAMSNTEHGGLAHLLGQRRTQDVTEDRMFYWPFSFFLTGWLLILIPKKKEDGRGWLCCFSFEGRINPRGFQKRGRILETTLRSSLVFFLCLDTSHNFVTVPCPWPTRSVSLFQPRSLHSLTQFTTSFVTVVWTWGIWPQIVSGLPSHLQYWKPFSLSHPGGIQCPRKDFMPTGWLAEPGFGPINSSDECLCLPLSFQLRADRVRFFFPSTLRSIPWTGLCTHSFVHSFPGHTFVKC